MLDLILVLALALVLVPDLALVFVRHWYHPFQSTPTRHSTGATLGSRFPMNSGSLGGCPGVVVVAVVVVVVGSGGGSGGGGGGGCGSGSGRVPRQSSYE